MGQGKPAEIARHRTVAAWFAHYNEDAELQVIPADIFLIVEYTNGCIEMASKHRTTAVEIISAYLEACLPQKAVSWLLQGQAIWRSMIDSSMTNIAGELRSCGVVLWFTPGIFLIETRALITKWMPVGSYVTVHGVLDWRSTGVGGYHDTIDACNLDAMRG